MFAMYEKDYIMRLIKDLVRALLKMLFNIDSSVSMDEIIRQAEEKDLLDKFISMINEGRICQAENEIFEITCDGDRLHLKTALIFYYRLAEKGDDFLKANNFSLDEVKDGVETIARRYKIEDLSSVFLN